MVVAVIYTGGARTVRDTLSQLIWCCDNSDEEVHIFASLDNTSPSLDDFIVSKLAHRLKAYIPILASSNSSTLDQVAAGTGMNEYIVRYLAHESGSIIEYKQIKTAADALVEYETKEQIRYSCIYRTRPDLYPTCPFNNVTSVNDQTLDNLLKRAAYMRTEPDAQFALAMASLHHKNRMLYNLTNMPRTWLFSTMTDSTMTDSTRLLGLMRDVLQSGKFFIGYRFNTYFVLGREALPAVISVFEKYGKMRPSKSDPPLGKVENWWDAEHQLFYALRDHDIMYATTVTTVEWLFDYTFRSEIFDENKHSVHPQTPDAAFFFWRPPLHAWRDNVVL